MSWRLTKATLQRADAVKLANAINAMVDALEAIRRATERAERHNLVTCRATLRRIDAIARSALAQLPPRGG
jgi:hypothetical protein